MPRPPEFTARELARLRMQALGLAGDSVTSRTVEGVVKHHLAMQAQDFRASRWAIGSRLPGSREADVVAAYDRGEVVRSWPMRGTVHAVPAGDLPWMLELMGPRALAGVKRRWENLGIDEAMLERAREVAVGLLAGGRRATRAEFTQALTDAGLDMTGQRAYHAVWYLSQTGTLVQGPVRNGDHELVLLDEWIPDPRRLDRDEALAELGRRYLEARGPATVDDLAHWTGLTKGDCRKAFEANADTLLEVRGPGGPFLIPAAHLQRHDPRSPAVDRSVLALAAFDEHLLGYRVRDCVLDPGHATRVDPGRNGVFRWTLVVGGRVAGTWKRTRRAHYTLVEIEPFDPVPARRRPAVRKALEAWAAFAGMTIRIRWPDAP
ncbi:MAG: winged helix DNA-binding domain-containing protein [Gemmatimonadales bacterium]|nr:MAG: winged helix DNA-binding domain-containing protein [Gemmatimonadales bacterium]